MSEFLRRAVYKYNLSCIPYMGLIGQIEHSSHSSYSYRCGPPRLEGGKYRDGFLWYEVGDTPDEAVRLALTRLGVRYESCRF